MAVARINVPKSAQRGEIIEIRTLISHTMETGYRRDYLGKTLPRDIITEFKCTYNGAEVCRATFHPAISANPYISFPVRITENGTLQFTWTGDNGFTQTESAQITVG
ncbi:MAG TPA: thiosulfate oxidation carrier complex protein SoxZ [Burkholderiales bacterium]|nr:thiosulfate oxidation carrier complex protein SoxZ [Burkholderiales bacterium]